MTQIKWLGRVGPVKALSHGGFPLEPVWYVEKRLMGPDYGGVFSDLISFSSTSETPVPAVIADVTAEILL